MSKVEKVDAVITGLGPISAIGCGRQDFWQALVAGQHGFGPITRCDVSFSPSRVGAEVKNFALEQHVEKGRVLSRRLPRSAQFALAASALALKDAGINAETLNNDRVGVCVGTSIANFAECLGTRDKWLKEDRMGFNPTEAFYLFNHSSACLLSSFFDFRGPMSTVSTGCNSGIDALGQSLRLIQLGLVDIMLVVGTDCELVPEIIAGMNASKSLATRFNDDPGRASRPFDLDRDGNVIGEGAAALVLEAEPHAVNRRAKGYARLAGYSVCSAGRNRKYSPNNPEIDIEPSMRAMQSVIEEAGWQAEDVDLVNANGSSSVLYDRLEALALAEVLGQSFAETRIHSIKSMLGQHGAGSSALQAVTACLSIAEGLVPPTINYENPDPACGPIRLVTEAESCSPKNVVTHSIGFGGFYYSCGAFAALN